SGDTATPFHMFREPHQPVGFFRAWRKRDRARHAARGIPSYNGHLRSRCEHPPLRGKPVSYQIFLCDLPPDCTDEQLAAHLQPYGTLAALEWLPSDDGTGLRRAMATVESDAPLLGIIGQLNQQPLGEQAIVASPAQPPDTPGDLSKRQIAASNEIAANLNEKARWPRMLIRQTVGACGVRFAMEMMRRAQEIDAGEGMLVPDGSHRRTVGGVFFCSSRQSMTADLGGHIFNETKETVKEQQARRKQAASAPAEEPAATPNEDAPPDPPTPDPTPEPSPA